VSTEEAEKVQVIVAGGVAREGLQEMVLPAEEAAAKRLADFVSDAAVDRMIADAQDAGISLLDGPGGLIGQLTARVIERALGAEMDDHLGGLSKTQFEEIEANRRTEGIEERA